MKLSKMVENPLKHNIISLAIDSAFDKITQLEIEKALIKDDREDLIRITMQINHWKKMIKVAEEWRKEI